MSQPSGGGGFSEDARSTDFPGHFQYRSGGSPRYAVLMVHRQKLVPWTRFHPQQQCRRSSDIHSRRSLFRPASTIWSWASGSRARSGMALCEVVPGRVPLIGILWKITRYLTGPAATVVIVCTIITGAFLTVAPGIVIRLFTVEQFAGVAINLLILKRYLRNLANPCEPRNSNAHGNITGLSQASGRISGTPFTPVTFLGRIPG
jgi:hypothetical protein